MTETIIGLISGVIVTMLISRYYFRKARNKRITPFIILDTNVFAGIDKDDRKKLSFKFQGEEVLDLHQLEFLIGNNGEIAISNYIKPLTLTLPKNVKALDASVIHRNPNELELDITNEIDENNNCKLIFQFPLLNKGDYFVLKLLLSGQVKGRDCIFEILADDLPRKIRAIWLPRIETGFGPFLSNWFQFTIFLCFMIFGFTNIYALYLIHLYYPALLPIPWETFEPTFVSLLFIVFAGLTSLFTITVGLLGVLVLIIEFISPKRVPFSIPEEIISHSFNFSLRQIYKLRGQKVYNIDNSKTE